MVTTMRNDIVMPELVMPELAMPELTEPGAPRRRRSAIGGFTLIEALVTITVLVILSSIAIPAFSSMFQNNRIRNAAYELMSSLAYARSEAIKRNTTAGVAPAAGGWSDGWTVDANGVGTPLKVVPVSDDVAIVGEADGAAFAGTVTYQRTGRVNGFTELRFTLRLADMSDDRFIRCVRVDFSGRATLERDVNQDGDCSNG